MTMLPCSFDTTRDEFEEAKKKEDEKLEISIQSVHKNNGVRIYFVIRVSNVLRSTFAYRMLRLRKLTFPIVSHYYQQLFSSFPMCCCCNERDVSNFILFFAVAFAARIFTFFNRLYVCDILRNISVSHSNHATIYTMCGIHSQFSPPIRDEC